MKDSTNPLHFLMNSKLMAVVYIFFLNDKKLLGIDTPKFIDLNLINFLYLVCRAYGTKVKRR
jgi:hypothetical protein